MLLSIIIPVRNEALIIADALMALRQWLSVYANNDSVQLIVVDGNSDDNTLAIAQQYADHAITSPAGRARQMNAGAAIARGRYLLFLHIDTQLPACDLMSLFNGTAAQWGFFPVKLSGQQWPLAVVAQMMNWRSRATHIGTGDQGLWVSSVLFQRVGGFDVIPLMEDVALCKTLRKVSKPVIYSEPVITSSRRWEEQGIYSTIALMWRLRWDYYRGVSPEQLVKKYYPEFPSSHID